MKGYPCDVHRLDEGGVITLYSKGHHSTGDMIQAVSDFLLEPLDATRRIYDGYRAVWGYARCVPGGPEGRNVSYLHTATGPGSGAFPITCLEPPL